MENTTEKLLDKSNDRGFVRVGGLADPHSGHRVGLIPINSPYNRHDEYYNIRCEMYEIYLDWINKYKPFDIVISNGDGVDGKGERSGGIEQLTLDMHEQAKIAADNLLVTDCNIFRLTRGTPYHTGVTAEWENTIVDKLRAEGIKDVNITDHGFYNIHGKEFNVKHHIGGSSIPHGRATALMREVLWNHEWYIKGIQPLADVLMRAHVHYSKYLPDDETNGTHAIIQPSLQGLGSKYGGLKCSGIVDFGVVIIDIYDNGEIKCKIEKMIGKNQKVESELLLP